MWFNMHELNPFEELILEISKVLRLDKFLDWLSNKLETLT